MRTKQTKGNGLAMLGACCGMIAALLHYLVPTYWSFLNKEPEIALTIVSAVFGVISPVLLALYFAVRIRAGIGMEGQYKFYFPAVLASAVVSVFSFVLPLVTIRKMTVYQFVPVLGTGSSRAAATFLLCFVPAFAAVIVFGILEQCKARRSASVS